MGEVRQYSFHQNLGRMALLTTERFWEIVAYQCHIQSGHFGVYPVTAPYSVFYLIGLMMPENKTVRHNACRTPDINLEFCLEDNCYLSVHEYSGLGPGDTQSLQAVRDFISYRTDRGRSATERLDAVWYKTHVEFALISVWLICFELGYVSPYLTPLMGTSERE